MKKTKNNVISLKRKLVLNNVNDTLRHGTIFLTRAATTKILSEEIDFDAEPSEVCHVINMKRAVLEMVHDVTCNSIDILKKLQTKLEQKVL